MSGFAPLLALAGSGVNALRSPAAIGVAAWLLAGVFTWSGLAKVRRPSLAAMAIVDFGLVRWVQPALGGLLGAAELLLALALALGLWRGFVLGAASALLWLFALLILRSLRQGAHFSCFCFGEADGALSRWTLIRTMSLALLATTATLIASKGPATTLQASFDTAQPIAALALLGTFALLHDVPRLLRWNRNHVVVQPTIRVEVQR